MSILDNNVNYRDAELELYGEIKKRMYELVNAVQLNVDTKLTLLEDMLHGGYYLSSDKCQFVFHFHADKEALTLEDIFVDIIDRNTDELAESPGLVSLLKFDTQDETTYRDLAIALNCSHPYDSAMSFNRFCVANR